MKILMLLLLVSCASKEELHYGEFDEEDLATMTEQLSEPEGKKYKTKKR